MSAGRFVLAGLAAALAIVAAASAQSQTGFANFGGQFGLRPTLVQDVQTPASQAAPAAPRDIAPFEIVPGRRPPPVAAEPKAAAPEPVVAGPDRFLVPFRRLRLTGELDRRAWVTYLTEDEAAQQASISLGYINAVVVMPEASRLRIAINGQPVVETPISSSTGVDRLTVPVRPGVLRAGQNLVQVEAVQRHRTDCTMSATYELWTDIVPELTGLSFAGGSRSLRGLDDLPAVGVDDEGATVLRFIAPNASDPQTAGWIMRLAQALALRGRYPHPIVRVIEPSAAGPSVSGMLTVVLAPISGLPALLGAPAEPGRSGGPAFVTDPRLGGPTLVIAGNSPTEIDRIVAEIEAPALRPIGVARRFLDTATWRAPDVPFFTRAGSVRLADLGITTEEFSGRRFRTRFAVGLPADFYAEAYGQATMYLDAAYTAEVLPTSHISVYVNGRIATTRDIASTTGGIFRRTPVDVPFRNFHAGVNEVVVEAAIETQSDARCLPGATLPGVPRFVLFDTTEFSMPNFARIGQLPDLSALGATGYPYNQGIEKIALVLGRHDAPTIGAAGTLLSRIARDSGRPLPTESTNNIAGLDGRLAILVGTAEQLPSGAFQPVGISDRIRSDWGGDGKPEEPSVADGNAGGYDAVLQRYKQAQEKGEPARIVEQRDPQAGTDNVYDRWSESVSNSGLRGAVDAVDSWLTRTFELSLSSLRLGSQTVTPYEPSARSGLILAQGNAAFGPKVWTILAGRSSEALVRDTARITDPEVWSRIGGRVTAFLPSTQTLQIQPVENLEFFPTQAWTVTNVRLIAANWMSSNILAYALALALSCVFLGLGTFAWVRGLGRPS